MSRHVLRGLRSALGLLPETKHLWCLVSLECQSANLQNIPPSWRAARASSPSLSRRVTRHNLEALCPLCWYIYIWNQSTYVTCCPLVTWPDNVITHDLLLCSGHFHSFSLLFVPFIMLKDLRFTHKTGDRGAWRNNPFYCLCLWLSLLYLVLQ